jgi:hypothetical protein
MAARKSPKKSPRQQRRSTTTNDPATSAAGHVSHQRTPPTEDEVRELLARSGFEIGDEIRVDGEGTRVYKVKGAWWDGSITCSAGEGIRSFMSDWCWPAYTVNSRGSRVDAKRPKEVVGRRSAWLAERGHTGRFASDTDATESGGEADDSITSGASNDKSPAKKPAAKKSSKA